MMTEKILERETDAEAHRDPITGAPGMHPIGTGLGAAAGGAAAGALAGTVAGPVGTVAGAVVGAVVGGLAGKGVAEAIDPTVEYTYWRENYASRPYVTSGSTFDDYGPAYQYGIDNYGLYKGRPFVEAEPDMMRDWTRAKGMSRLSWDNAKPATRDAYQRMTDLSAK
jgi:hypothetical protein